MYGTEGIRHQKNGSSVDLKHSFYFLLFSSSFAWFGEYGDTIQHVAIFKGFFFYSSLCFFTASAMRMVWLTIRGQRVFFTSL